MKRYRNIVVLTGAGISAESGIRTFRDSNGLWENHRVEDVASPEGYARNAELVLDFYNQRRKQLLSEEVTENEAHRALARLEQEFDGEFLLVTQNIDDLHERSGSKQLIHIHGELLKQRCNSCNHVSEIRGNIMTDSVCESCGDRGTLRPHIVWFGEMPFEMERIEIALQQCDLFVSIGTSGAVYPAAGFVSVANACGADTVSLNLDEADNSSNFDRSHFGPATKIVPEFVTSLLEKQSPSPGEGGASA